MKAGATSMETLRDQKDARENLFNINHFWRANLSSLHRIYSKQQI
jgi:hypothetical protein